MQTIIATYDRCVAQLRAPGADGVALLTRVTLGWLFIDSGWQKWHNLDQIVPFFASLGIPYPQLQAPMVATVELLGGALVLAGLLTRLASLPLMGTMVVAMITAKKDDLHGFSDLIGFVEYLYLLALMFLLVWGAGRLSLDWALARSRSKD